MNIGMKLSALGVAVVIASSSFALMGCTVRETSRPVVVRPRERVVVHEEPVVRERVYVR